jgi:hypothetical protein
MEQAQQSWFFPKWLRKRKKKNGYAFLKAPFNEAN